MSSRGPVRVLNLRRRAAPVHRPRPAHRGRVACPVCGVRLERAAGLVFGDADPGSLAADQLVTGLCSVDCLATWYGLEDADRLPVCLCGAPIFVAGADCVRCQASLVLQEDGGWVYSPELAVHGIR